MLRHKARVLLVCLTGLVCPGSGAEVQLATISGNVCSGERVLLMLKPEFKKEIATAAPGRVRPTIQETLALPAGLSIRAPAIAGSATKPDGEAEVLRRASFLIVDLHGKTTVEEALRWLGQNPAVESVEPDWLGSGGATPNDPYYSAQWHHPIVQAPAAWDITTGSASVIVAVLDTGVNTTLSEFSGRVVPGYDFVNGDADPSDDQGHGTAVAGTVVANANNSTLVAGTDWNCRLMPIKVLDANNSGFYSWWAAGIDWATASGAKVINLSAGGFSGSTTLTSSIMNAIANGVIFVTITHNDGTGTIRFPGTLAAAITVGATERNDEKTPFSNWGSSIDLVAPGRDIYTVGMNGSLTYWWGTSFAAPQVAGAAALLASVFPTLTQTEAEALLTLGADDGVGNALDAPGFDDYHGWGRLNVLNSLTLARTELAVSMVPGSAQVKLAWNAPANVASKNAYKIRFSPNLSSWTIVDQPVGISYVSGRAEWIDNGSQTGGLPGPGGRYYQILVSR